MVFISTITLFSFTEKTKFSTSQVYKWIEYLTIAAIIGACGAELATLVTELAEQFISGIKNLRKDRIKQKMSMKEQIAKGEKEDKWILDLEDTNKVKSNVESSEGFDERFGTSNLLLRKKDKLLRGKAGLLRKLNGGKKNLNSADLKKNQISLFEKGMSHGKRKVDISVKQKSRKHQNWTKSGLRKF